jgi:hypothetical protein
MTVGSAGIIFSETLLKENAMKTHRILFNLAIFGFCFYACTGPNVRTDFDPAADFAKFRTFAFAGLTDMNRGGVFDNSLTRTRIESTVAGQLNKKGLQQVQLDKHPNLLVHYWVDVKDKQRVQSSGPTAGAYGWGGAYGTGAGNVWTYEYKEGTLIVDLVEPTKKELVWRATMVADLSDTAQENVETGKKAIARAFENYPPKRSQ